MKKITALRITAAFFILLTSFSYAQNLDNLTLIAHYPLSSTANDTTGNYGPMELTNTPFQDGGIYCNGNYIGTEADSCDAKTPLISGLNFKKFAMSAMFKVDDITTTRRPVIVGGWLYKWCTLFITPDSMVGLAQGGYFGSSSSSGVHYSSDTWHTIAFTYDTTEGMGRLYLDGAAVDSSTRELSHHEDRFFSITNGSVSRTFHGYLKDVKIYSFEAPLTDRQQDSLALVSFYNSTDGPNWTDNEHWLSGPLDTWKGITLTAGRVTSIALSNNNVTGTIPVEIGSLDSLKTLYLNSNALSDTIPSEIANCLRLHTLYLGYNQLSGSIPPELGNLTYLIRLYLDYNQLSGSIPKEIGSLENLENLYLTKNQLEGSIPPELGQLSSLKYLLLNLNSLTGTIPEELGDLTSLEHFQATSNYQLAGPIPGSFVKLTNLWALELGYCQLEGAVPSWLGSLTKLTRLMLNDNQFTGTIPDQIWGLTALTALRLEKNQLEGSIPADVTNLVNLSTFRINRNQFTGLPDITSMPSLSQVYLQNNKFTFEDIEPNVGVSGIVYTPQDSVGMRQDTTVAHGSDIVLSVSVGGTANEYQWNKEGVIISGADSSSYAIEDADSEDEGVYMCVITNTICPELTLYSHTISLKVTPPVGVEDELSTIPAEFALHQNFPNPFNPNTLIRYEVPEKSDVEISIFNISGEQVKKLSFNAQAAGYHEIEWNGRSMIGKQMPSGIYLCRLSSGKFVSTVRMLLLK